MTTDGSCMKKIVLLIVFLFAIPASAMAATQDVLAHSVGEWTWFAHVSRIPGVVPTAVPGSNEQTECFSLQSAPGQQWNSLPVLPGRAIAIAARSSQLAVLMSNGQWLTLWEDGSASGEPLPANGKIKAISDDGTHLWAIGWVNGGIAAANKAIAAATQPTTMPGDTNEIASSEPVRSIPGKMVVFHEVDGQWATFAELPADAIINDDTPVSFTIMDGAPLVAFKTPAGVLRTARYIAGGQWKDIIKPIEDPSAANFRVLSDGFKPFLWWTNGNTPGELYMQGATGDPQTTLAWVSKDQLDGLPTATIAGGYLCVFGPHAGKVLEQRYKLNGTPFETAAELKMTDDTSQSLLPRWMEVVFLTSMGFSVGASVFRQWSEPEKGPVVEPPAPAPILPRLAAGLLDALPVIGALFYLGLKTDAFNDPAKFPALKAIIILASAVVVYLLHTTLLETFTGRSAGKWVFGLKVVTLEGEAPKRSQLLIRNLLRVIDPLVMIIISPQGQRSADAVAATMVVPLEPLPVKKYDDENQD
jgi:uncharacterized RDD family membrane protein YckC